MARLAVSVCIFVALIGFACADIGRTFDFWDAKATQLNEYTQSIASIRPADLAPAFFQASSTASGAGSAANDVANSLGGSDIAQRFRDALPRWGYSSDINDVGNSKAQNYAIGIGIQAAYGIVLAVLTFLVGCCFCCCRCCCNWCGGREPIEGGYTKCQRWGTLVIMLVFALASAVFTALGFYNNDQLTQGLVGNTGVMGTILKLFTDAINFLTGDFNSIRSLLGNLSRIFNGIIDQIVSAMGGTSVLFTSVGALTNQINTTVGVVKSVSITNYTCTFCSTASAKADDMFAAINRQTDSAIKNMKDTVKSVNTTIIDMRSQISSQVNSSIDSLNSAAKTITDIQTTVKNANDQVKSVDGIRNLVVLVILIIPCTSFLFMLCGGIARAGCPFTAYYWIGYIISFIVFLLFTIHLPIAVVLSDACFYVGTVDSNFTKVSSLGDSAKIVDACIYNKSLVSTYNLDDKLNFSSQVKFPDFPNFAANLSIAPLNTFVIELRAVNYTTFGYSMSNLNTAITNTNTYCSPTTAFTRATITSCNQVASNSNYLTNSTCKNICDGAIAMYNAEASMNTTITNFHNSANDLDTAATSFKNDVNGVYNNLQGLKNTTSPLFSVAQDFRNLAYCGFIGTAYFSLKKAICATIMNSMTMLSLCFFLIGILNFPVIVCSTILAKRLPNPKSDDAALVVELGPPGSGGASRVGMAPIGGPTAGGQGMSIAIAAPPPPPLVTIRPK